MSLSSCERTWVLNPTEPLEVSALADWLDIEIWTPHQVPELESKWTNILLKKDPDSLVGSYIIYKRQEFDYSELYSF